MHCAAVPEALSASTADWTVLYFPLPPTAKQPAGADVRPARGTSAVGAATADAASERTKARDASIVKK